MLVKQVHNTPAPDKLRCFRKKRKHAISFSRVFFKLRHAVCVAITCIIARAIVKYVNQSVKKPGRARQRAHQLTHVTDSVAHIKIIRRKIHKVWLLFRKRKADMEESDLRWKQTHRNCKTDYQHLATDNTKHILCSFFIIVNYVSNVQYWVFQHHEKPMSQSHAESFRKTIFIIFDKHEFMWLVTNDCRFTHKICHNIYISPQNSTPYRVRLLNAEQPQLKPGWTCKW